MNDKDLKDVQFSTYADKFSYVNQDNDLLPFSFEQNITLGRKMSKYSLKDLVTIFNLESIFDKERDNLDFEHLNLSGGEKQRICLARAIYRNKKWLSWMRLFLQSIKQIQIEYINSFYPIHILQFYLLNTK